MAYIDRLVDPEIERLLGFAGALLIEGPRACGKTSTGSHHANSELRLDTDDNALELASLNPSLTLQGARPRLIDEWQLAPKLWNHVRRAVDDQDGGFILTGSAVPPDDITRHSGAGRILRLRMRPMTLSESGHSTKEVSLREIFEGVGEVAAVSDVTLDEMADRIAIGGWPALQGLSPRDAQSFMRSYLDDIARVDLKDSGLGEAHRDPRRVSRFLRAYARHVATPATTATITSDTAIGGEPPIHQETAAGYLTLLERLMVIEEQHSWAPHLRSRDTVRKGSIRHFVDPSLAVAGLRASSLDLLHDAEAFGLLFESLVIRDLRVYSELLGGEVRHYRDSAGSEADAIIQLDDGRWVAVEVKLSPSRADDASRSLERLIAKIDTDRVGAPVARLVITGTGYAYTRPDGTHVVPLACLAP